MSGRRWGWHRLAEEWAEAVVAAANIRPGDLVVDLGAGAGGLTLQLLDAGARVIAVELHAGRAGQLRERIEGRNAVVVQCDLRIFSPPGQPFRVVANPPFALTSTVLALLSSAQRLRRADLVLQRSVVTKLDTGERRVGRHLQVHRTLDLPRQAFRPPPAVGCSVVALTSARTLPRGQPWRAARAR